MLLIKKIHEISSEIELEALEKGSKVKESTVQKPYFNGGIEAPDTHIYHLCPIMHQK
jgi:hypothetical protein